MKTEDIKHLVFKGGGFNGISFIGALKKLEDISFNFNQIESVAGTSIGALISLLVCVGYTPTEIFCLISKKNFTEFRKISVFNIFKNFGLDDGKNIIKWVVELIVNKGFNEKITYKQMFDLTHKKFISVACNLNTYETLYCDYINTPDMEIITGIRMSMAVPFLFTPVFYNDNYYVDGGMTEIFPLSLFLKEEKHTLGLRLVYNKKNNIENIYEFGMRVVDCLMLRIENNEIEKYNFPNILEINVDSKNFINYNLDEIQKKELCDIGFSEMEKIIN